MPISQAGLIGPWSCGLDSVMRGRSYERHRGGVNELVVREVIGLTRLSA